MTIVRVKLPIHVSLDLIEFTMGLSYQEKEALLKLLQNQLQIPKKTFVGGTVRICEICQKEFVPKSIKSKLCGDLKCYKERARRYSREYMKTYIPGDTTYKRTPKEKPPKNDTGVSYRKDYPINSVNYLSLIDALRGNTELSKYPPSRFCLNCGAKLTDVHTRAVCSAFCHNLVLDKIWQAFTVIKDGLFSQARVYIKVNDVTGIYLKPNENLLTQLDFFKR